MAAGDQPNLLGRFQEFWTSRDVRQRGIIASVVAVVVVAVAIGALARRGQWTPLYTDIEPADFNAIVSQLETERVPYQVHGDVLFVPRDRVPSIRASLFEAGLPAGAVKGLELFDERELGLTEQEFEQKRERAVQGELVRTIRAMRGVRDAKVGIVFPKETLFKEDQTPSTAAVQVDYAGTTIPQKTVDAVALMVSHWVPGLGVENIVITDTAGSYYKPAGQAQDGISPSEVADRERHRRDYEETLGNRLQQLLDKVVGPNRAAVSVSVAMAWERQSEETVNYSNDEGTGKPYTTHEKTTTSTYDGTYPGGLEPGVGPNVPPASPESPLAPVPPPGSPTALTPGGTAAAGAGPTYPSAGSGKAKMEYSGDEVDRVFDTSKVTRQSVPPSISRVSVGVILDESQVDDALAQQLEQAVSSAAGIDLARGDVITVSRIPFYSPPEGGGPKGGLMAAFGSWLIPIIVALIGLGGIVVTHRACNPQAAEEAGLAGEMVEGEVPAYSLDQLIAEHVPTEDELVQQQASERVRETFAAVTDYAKADPESFAQLLRTWLAED